MPLATLRPPIMQAFGAAAQEVLRAEAALDVVCGSAQLLPQLSATAITVRLGLAGDLIGAVLYSLSEQNALVLATQLLGEPTYIFDSLTQSSLSEVGNVITGVAVFKLARLGYRLTVTPPLLFSGSRLPLAALDLPTVFMPLVGVNASIGLHLRLRPNF